MHKNKINYQLVNILLVAIIAFIVVYTKDYWGGFILKVFDVIFPFFLAFVIAYVLHPFVKFLEGKGVRKNLAIAIIVVLLLAAIVAILWITLPMLYDQLLMFANSLSQFMRDMSTRFDMDLGNTGITDILNKLIEQLGAYVSSGTVDVIGKSINIIGKACIALVVGVYLLFDMDRIRARVKHELNRISRRTTNFVRKLDTEIGNYFHGFFILMIVTFVEYSVLYRIIGHPNWMIMGVIMAVSIIIPYFGGIVGNCIGIITASVVSTPVLIGSVLICIIFANVDGYVISPKIYGKTNNLNPIAIIFAITVGGALFGFLGIVAAIPLYITIRCAYNFYEDDIKEKIGDIMEDK